MEKHTLIDFFRWLVALSEHCTSLLKKIVSAVDSCETDSDINAIQKPIPASVDINVIKELLESRRASRIEQQNIQSIRNRAFAERICPNCAGNLVDVSSFFQKHIADKMALECDSCREKYVLQLVFDY